MGKLISEKIKYDGPRFKVLQKKYRRDDGLEYIRDCVEPGNAVVILPITNNNEVIFIKQQREAINKIVLELPAGMIDKNETPEFAAKRELEEETGIKANKIIYLTEFYPSCGYTNEKLYIYLAENFEKTKQHLDFTEEILSVEKIPLEECMKMLENNEFEHAQMQIALYTYYYKYYNGGENGKHKKNDNINRFR